MIEYDLMSFRGKREISATTSASERFLLPLVVEMASFIFFGGNDEINAYPFAGC